MFGLQPTHLMIILIIIGIPVLLTIALTRGAKQTTVSESMQYASVLSRIVAFVIDFFLLLVALPVIATVGNTLDQATGCVGCAPRSSAGIITNILTLAWLIGLVLYFILGEGKYGQTLGKKWLKIRVVRTTDGTTPGYGRVFFREILKALFLGTAGSVISGLAFLWAIWDGQKQTWYDKITGTTVIKTE